ncbi:MAG TPA: ATP-binding protein [Steroidobacteraceae bacterium]|nr:ATP-binding protein [Steroidobacteraceae bacterium]
MHSLFFRIFVLFWVAMALIVGGSIAVTFTIAAHEYEAPELQRRPSVAIQAGDALTRGGLPALKHWLQENKGALPGRDLYIVGPDGADILGRRLSESAVRRLEFFNRDEILGREAEYGAREPEAAGPDAGGDHAGQPPEREPPPAPRDAPPSTRDAQSSLRDAPPAPRDAPPSTRDAQSSLRDAPPSPRDAPPSSRDAQSSLRDAPPSPRDAPPSSRNAQSSARDTQRPPRDAGPLARGAESSARDALPPTGARTFGRGRQARLARLAPLIAAPDGTLYTVLLVPRRPSIFGALSLPEISLAILCIALIVSAMISWWLAQHLSAPIRRIQEGARALASERLDVRVSAGLDGRRDEVAVLARDFDAMADRLRANRAATTRLLRDVSHELRSPLARMRVALGLARQPPADIARQLDRLEREVERLDSLINQVLKLARLQGTEAPLTRETFDLDEVIEEIVHDASFEGAAKHSEITRRGLAGAPISGNRELLRSAIENVLRNALRYSPDGRPIDVEIARDAGEVSLVIRDRGPGVPSGDLERIFQPFYRVAESRDRDSGGEGIGLAITAQVMKAHGGSARAANIEDGFEILLTLPIDGRPS